MREYRKNKIKTAYEITQLIENWPVAFGMRIWKERKGMRLLNFRNGLNVACRAGTGDWAVIHELLFVDNYATALDSLKQLKHDPLVLDLGGNIGLFSLLATLAHPKARVYAYEPGPPNYRLFEINCLANPALAQRIELRKEAVAGKSRVDDWSFDDANPGGSGFFSVGSSKFKVQIRSFQEVVESLPGPVDLAKIDIEGAEFELLSETPAYVWKKINVIALELHDDPNGKVTRADFIAHFQELGFKSVSEELCTILLSRS